MRYIKYIIIIIVTEQNNKIISLLIVFHANFNLMLYVYEFYFK